MELTAHDLVTTSGPSLTLTDGGRSAIAECAAWLEREPGGSRALLQSTPDELEEALHRLAASALGASREELADDIGQLAEKVKAARRPLTTS
jgi:hypothetical protein